MWSKTRITELLKLRYPIVQGPFGNGPSSPRLVAAVSNSGGLGSYGAVQMQADALRDVVSQIRARTNRPFAINLWVPLEDEVDRVVDASRYDVAIEHLRPYYAELGVGIPARLESVTRRSYETLLDVVLDERPAVFSFIFGVPDRAVLDECRARGIVTIGTATHVDEAVALDEAGVDIIVASGSEAGGHRAAFLRPADEAMGVMALVPQVADAVRVPVIAAGGIADGRGVAAAFALGAEGVQIGTAFLVCEESNANATHRAALRSDAARYTTLTRSFTGRYARSVKNRYIDEMRTHESSLPPYPIQALLTLNMRQAAAAQSRTDLTNLWCGQSAGLARHTDAEALMHSLIADTQRVFSRLRTA